MIHDSNLGKMTSIFVTSLKRVQNLSHNIMHDCIRAMELLVEPE